MRKDLLLSEVLTRVHNSPSVPEKVKILKSFETPGLLHILKYAFGPNLEFDTGVPDYNPSIRPAGTDYASLQGEARRLYIFVKDYQKVTPQRKRELLLQILESINVTEAKLLVQIINKNIKVDGLTPELVNTAFPGLLDYRENGKIVKYPDPNAKPERTLTSENLFDSSIPMDDPSLEPDLVTKSKTPRPISKNRKVIV